MAVAARGRRFDRARVMKRAAGAAGKRRRKKAISLYRQVLEVDPEDADAHRKIAPLLAQTGKTRESLVSYRKAVDAMLRQGFDDRAIGLIRAAAGYLPREFELWRSLASLQANRGRTPDAVASLLEGRRHFRSRQDRGVAILLLSQAQKLDPSSFWVSYDLACQLGKAGRRSQARQLLEQLAARPGKPHLRRVRARQLWLAPSLGALWRLARACVLSR